MKGDFSRFLFDREKHYVSVLMQQGRVQLDSDWNEQVEINSYLREMAGFDVVGPYGMPSAAPGFQVIVRQGMRFDGKNDFIHGGDEPDLSFSDTKALTLAVCIKPDLEGSGGVLVGRFGQFNTTELPEYVLSINRDRTISFVWVAKYSEVKDTHIYRRMETIDSEVATAIRKDEIKEESVQPNMEIREIRTVKAVDSDRFTHVAVTLDAKKVIVYVDGQPAARQDTGDLQVKDAGSLLIGSGWGYGNPFYCYRGVIDSVVVWNKALKQHDVLENIFKFLKGDEKGLLRLWRLNNNAMIKGKIKDYSPFKKNCLPGHGKQEYVPGWETPHLWIGRGRAYVRGKLCELDKDILFTDQPNQPVLALPQPHSGIQPFLFYLDVWKRHITRFQDPEIREVALGGPDTTTRQRLIWQVNYIPTEEAADNFQAHVDKGLMKARHKPAGMIHENRLYRVEVHSGGGIAGGALSQRFYPVLELAVLDIPKKQAKVKAWTGEMGTWHRGRYVEFFGVDKEDKPLRFIAMITEVDFENGIVTVDNIDKIAENAVGLRIRQIVSFKWSRQNGTIVFPIVHIQGQTLVVEDTKGIGFGLAAGQWVEVTDEPGEIKRRSNPLLRIDKLDRTPEGNIVMTLSAAPELEGKGGVGTCPLARVWDHGGDGVDESGGVIPVKNTGWLDLDEGVQISFQGGGTYHTGDYWWIPVRSETQTIEWPRENHQASAIEPHGIDHAFATLAMVAIGPDKMEVKNDLRMIFEPLVADQL